MRFNRPPSLPREEQKKSQITKQKRKVLNQTNEQKMNADGKRIKASTERITNFEIGGLYETVRGELVTYVSVNGRTGLYAAKSGEFRGIVDVDRKIEDHHQLAKRVDFARDFTEFKDRARLCLDDFMTTMARFMEWKPKTVADLVKEPQDPKYPVGTFVESTTGVINVIRGPRLSFNEKTGCAQYPILYVKSLTTGNLFVTPTEPGKILKDDVYTVENGKLVIQEYLDTLNKDELESYQCRFEDDIEAFKTIKMDAMEKSLDEMVKKMF